jgi:hypothetical protein
MEIYMKKIITLLFAVSILLSACGTSPDEPVSSEPSYPSYPNEPIQSAYSPKPEDATLIRSEVYIDSNDLLILESFPLQFMLNIKGNLPTPCNALRIFVNPPDAENKIYVDVYSVINPDKVCVQVLSPFEVNVSLGSFPTGKYILFVNGNQVAEFDA